MQIRGQILNGVRQYHIYSLKDGATFGYAPKFADAAFIAQSKEMVEWLLQELAEAARDKARKAVKGE